MVVVVFSLLFGLSDRMFNTAVTVYLASFILPKLTQGDCSPPPTPPPPVYTALPAGLETAASPSCPASKMFGTRLGRMFVVKLFDQVHFRLGRVLYRVNCAFSDVALFFVDDHYLTSNRHHPLLLTFVAQVLVL